MKHHDKALVTVLVVALFSLFTLQGLTLLSQQQNESQVLGITNYNPCTTNSQCDSGYCNLDKKQCQPKPVAVTPYISTVPNPMYPTSTPAATSSTSQTVPCDVINNLQKLYCSSPAPISVYPTTVKPGYTCDNKCTSLVTGGKFTSQAECSKSCTVTIVTPTPARIGITKPSYVVPTLRAGTNIQKAN